MSRPRIESILAGNLGYFWVCESGSFDPDEDQARPGWIEHRDRGIEVRLLVEDVRSAVSRSFAGARSAPQAIVGVTEDVGLLVLDVVGSGRGQLHLMGALASTEGFIAQTVVASNDVSGVQRPLPSEATIRLQGTALFDWAHTQAYASEIRTNPATNLIEGATLESTRPNQSRRVSPAWGTSRSKPTGH